MAEPHTLIFFTAQWCAPAVPMVTIFEETIRDLTRLHPGLELTGVVVDLDELDGGHVHWSFLASARARSAQLA